MLNLFKSAIIIVVVLLYWKFVYYPYHKKLFTPLSFVIFGGPVALVGLYCLFIKKTVDFLDYGILFYILVLFTIISFTLVLIGWKNHGLISGVDITLNWTYRLLGKPFVYLAMIISFPFFFILMAGTYKILGQEHIIFWAMIFLAWIRSNYRLFTKYVIK